MDNLVKRAEEIERELITFEMECERAVEPLRKALAKTIIEWERETGLIVDEVMIHRLAGEPKPASMRGIGVSLIPFGFQVGTQKSGAP